jgi:hypothetical protein
MKLRKEYEELKGLFIDDKDILVDEDDSFSFYTKNGIMGFNRNVETFWRNRDLGDEDDA